MPLLAHSGDLGDVLYALPAFKAMGGGHVVLYRGEDVREPFTPERAANLARLLETQPYVDGVSFAERRPRRADLDSAAWRATYDGFANLAYDQARAYGIDPGVCDEPWLSVDPAPVRQGGKIIPVVVCRSHRYRQPDFPWPELADRFRDRAVVVGSKSEAEELLYCYGFRRHVETRTLLDVARVIAGAELVITNQTCAYAIARGLGKRVALERWPFCPNVDFAPREGLYTGERILELLCPNHCPPLGAPSPETGVPVPS